VLLLSKAQKKYRDEDAWNNLIDEDVIKIDGDNITIAFLDEQFEERGIASQKARDAANKRWSKDPESDDLCNRNATAMQPHTDSIAGESGEHAIKRERKEEREEKRKEERERAEVARDEFDLIESSKEMARPIAKYFAIAEVAQHQKFAQIVEFCKWIQKNAKRAFFEIQFDHYQLYKSKSEEQKHGLASYIGTPPDYGGAWNSCDWKKKLENYQPRGFKPKRTPQLTFDKNE
jgi:hypothetical protein